MSWIDSSRDDLDVPVDGGTHRTAVWTHPARPASAASAAHGGPDHPARPLLLVHGFRGDHHGMDLIAHHVRRHPAVVPDLPGFGATAPLPDGLSLDAYAGFLSGLHDSIEQRYGVPPLVVGHSFGSILVARLAALRARQDTPLDALALINPITAPALEGPSRLGSLLARAYYSLAARLPERAGDALLGHSLIVRGMSEVMATTRDPGLRRYIHDQHRRYFSTYTDRDSLARAFAISISHTAAEAVDSLTMPVLVISGGADSIAPPAATRAFVDSLPDVRSHAFDGVGHLVHYERPEQTARLLEAFAAEVERSTLRT